MIVFWIGEFYSGHHLRNSASLCKRRIFLYQPPGKHETNRRDNEDHPKIPIQYLIECVLAKSKYLSVQNCNDSRNDRANPKWNSLQKVFLQPFIMNVIKRSLENFPDVQ